MHAVSVLRPILYSFWVHGEIVPRFRPMKKAISSEDYLHLIGWLTQARLDLNWSMRDLAGKLDVPHSFVQRVETLERRLDVYEYVVYCRTLGVNPFDGLRFLAETAQDKK